MIKNWKQIMVSAIVFAAIVIGLMTFITFCRWAVSSSGVKTQQVTTIYSPLPALPLDDPRNLNYSETIDLAYLPTKSGIPWSKRIILNGVYIQWDESPQTAIAVMRNGDPRDVHIVKAGENYNAGYCTCIQFVTLGWQTKLHVFRPQHLPY